MASDRCYITTPIYYVNAKPHIGHYYTTLLADVLKRHHAQRSIKAMFLTGTDEHGEKIEQMAKEAQKPVKMFVDEIAKDFEVTWQDLGIDFDIFYRTTDHNHTEKVQHALQTLKDKGEIVYREYEGNYCVGCERFLTDSELNKEGECPDHLRKPEARKESNYFFLMSAYQERLIQHIESNPDFIRPESYRNEILSFLKQPLGDLCVSRPKSRLTWGIEMPFDSNFVTYVWFDALLNYVNAIGWPKAFDKALWANCIHLVGKDILKAHAIYWPTMLMALEIPMFHSLQVGGYWLMSGNKMSKSLGNVLRPKEIEAQFGAETLRFYLLRDMSYGQDSSFSMEGYVNGINAHLANGIGNLTSRVLTLCQKNFHGSYDLSKLTEADQELLGRRAQSLDVWDQAFTQIKYQNALKAWSDLVSHVDLYVNTNKPWAMAKDPTQSERLQVVLGVCLEMLLALGVLIYPVLPRTSKDLLSALGLDGQALPTVEMTTKLQQNFKISETVPKLFMRVELPA